MSKVVPIRPQLSLTERMALEGRQWITSVELCVAADLTYRQVDHWTRTGLLDTFGPRFSGQGCHRHYPLPELDKAKALSALIAAGIDLRTAHKHIDEFLTAGFLQAGPVTITYTPEHTP